MSGTPRPRCRRRSMPPRAGTSHQPATPPGSPRPTMYGRLISATARCNFHSRSLSDKLAVRCQRLDRHPADSGGRAALGRHDLGRRRRHDRGQNAGSLSFPCGLTSPLCRRWRWGSTGTWPKTRPSWPPRSASSRRRWRRSRCGRTGAR